MGTVIESLFPRPRSKAVLREIYIDNGSGDCCLLCPNCGIGYLHHEGVVVYDREEDRPYTIETFVRKGLATTTAVPSETSQNPSGRRDGIAIEFSCEGCYVRPELTIEQHKGQTYLAWRF